MTEHDLEFLCLKEGFTGSSESTLVKMPHLWKSCVTAHISNEGSYMRVHVLLNLLMVLMRSNARLAKHLSLFATSLIYSKVQDHKC